MVQIADHLGVADLQAGWRESKDVTLTRHYQVIWLLAEGRDRGPSGVAQARRTRPRPQHARAATPEEEEAFKTYGPPRLHEDIEVGVRGLLKRIRSREGMLAAKMDTQDLNALGSRLSLVSAPTSRPQAHA